MLLMHACAPESGAWLAVLPCLQVREQLQWGWGRWVLCAHGHTRSPCVLSSHGLGLDCEQLWVSTGQAVLNQLASHSHGRQASVGTVLLWLAN